MGCRRRIRPGRTFSPLRRRGRLRQPARPCGCTSSSGRSSSESQRWSLSPTVISEASSRFLIRSPTTRRTPPSIQGGQARPAGRHHARLPSSRITLGRADAPDDSRIEKQPSRGASAAGIRQQARPGLIRPARASASPQPRVRARRRARAPPRAARGVPGAHAAGRRRPGCRSARARGRPTRKRGVSRAPSTSPPLPRCARPSLAGPARGSCGGWRSYPTRPRHSPPAKTRAWSSTRPTGGSSTRSVSG